LESAFFMIRFTFDRTTLRLISRRVLAYLLDIVLLFLVLAPVGALIQWLFMENFPQTGPEIWRTLLWNFSLPVWIYFTINESSAHGGTVGKRMPGLRVTGTEGAKLSLGWGLLRTAVKLLPWELVHLSAFALSGDMTVLTAVQTIGLTTANLLVLVYALLLLFTNGARSLHDFATGTKVSTR
jgi:uncharacterized RDD family membrane protein YckC